MKFVIDEEICKQNGMSVQLLLYLLAVNYDCEISNLELRKEASDACFAIFNPKTNKSELTEWGIKTLEKIILNSEFKPGTKEGDRFEILAEALQEVFPKGRKEGTTYLWRDSKHIIADRLRTLVKKYGDCFTNEEAIEAAKKYVESFNGNYHYMQLLKYFIFKNNANSGEVEKVSQLLSYIENNRDSELSFVDSNSFDELRV